MLRLNINLYIFQIKQNILKFYFFFRYMDKKLSCKYIYILNIISYKIILIYKIIYHCNNNTTNILIYINI